MPTIFERLDVALSGNTANAEVGTQVDALFNVSAVLQSLATNPPDEVGDLTGALGAVELPAFEPGSFITQIDSIRDAVPTDTSGLLAGILGDIAQLETQFGSQITDALRNALVAFERIQALAQIDLSCGLSAAGLGDGAGSPAEGEPEPEPGEETPGESETQPTRLSRASAEMNTALDRFPTPFNVRSLLTFLHGATAFRRDMPMIPPLIPVFDDVRDPLDTLIAWESLTPAQIRAAIEVSISETTTFIGTGLTATLAPLTADASELIALIPAEPLERIATRITIRLAELREAVLDADLTDTAAGVAEINSLLDEYDVLRPTLDPLFAGVDPLALRVRDLAADLDDGMAHMIGVLRPGGAVLSRLPQPAALAIEPLERFLTDITDWLDQVVEALDLSAVQEPIAAIADSTRDVAAGLQQAIVGVTVQVQSMFAEVEALLDAIDPTAAQADVTTAVEQFRDQLVGQVGALVAPARDALMTALGEVDGAIDGFDPQQIVAVLTDAINAIAAVLQDGDVANAINEVRNALDQAAEAIAALEFTPVTDGVIDVIDGIRDALSAIDPALLPGPAVAALEAAASVLPDDLEPVTTPLLTQFGTIIDEGPIPLLQTIRDQPAQLLEAVRGFDPGALIGEQISEPFDQIVRELERFRPSALLEPVGSELDGLKTRLADAASPGALVEPLAAPFAEMRSAFAAFDPGALVQPIDDALSDAMANLLEILPVDETFDVVDDALGAVRHVVESVDDVTAVLRRVRDMVEGLSDPRPQLEAWVDEVLDQVDAIGSTTSLQPLFAALGTALDATRAAPVQSAVDSALADLRAALTQAGGTARIAALIQAHVAVPRAALDALPASADRTALQAALDRLDPMRPAFGAPWQKLGTLQTALATADTETAVLLTVWDDRFHSAASALAELRQAEATPAQLRAWADETLQQQFVEPLTAALGPLAPFGDLLDTFVARLDALLTAVTDRLAGVLLGPDSLEGIRNALAQIVDNVLDFDLQFLRDSIDALFANVQSKLDTVSPEQIGALLDEAFTAVLDTISLEMILPAAELATLDDSWNGIVDKLRALDPAVLVSAIVDPLFEDTVLPLLEAFDLSPALDVIIEKLDALDEELIAELVRVNTAYQAMLAAVPGGGDQSASVSVAVA